MPLPPELSDKCLAARGDSEALSILYQRHSTRLLAYLASLAGSDTDLIDELFNETWLRVVEKLPGTFPGSAFRVFLKTIAYSRFVDHWRAQKRLRPLENYPDKGVQPPEPPLDEDLRARLAECLEKLRARSPESALVFVALAEGLDVLAIAAKLGLDAQQVYRRTNQAKAALQDCVGRTKV